jgi:hypothetical protein
VAFALHRVAGVDGEVDDRILKLVRIDVGRPRIRGHVEVHHDPLAERAVEQVRHAADQLGRVDPLGQQRLRPSERQ